jgi:hypothetical protein
LIIGDPSREEVVVGEGVYWQEEDARKVLAEWSASGLSMAAFARREGLAGRRLRRWHSRLSRSEALPCGDAQFVSLAVDPLALAPQPICVVVGAVRIEVPAGFDEATLERLVRVLSC